MTNDSLVKRVFNSYLFIGILAMITATVGVLVDGIVVGQFMGQQSFSAFGLASPIVILTAAVAGIFSNGGSTACSIRMGQGDERGVRMNFTVTCVGALIVAVLFTLVMVFFNETVARLLGAEGALLPLTADYVRGLGLGMIPTVMCQVIMIYIRLNNGIRLSFFSVLAMTVCNITLDLVFALLVKNGMFGMGLATSISYLVALLVCCLHFLKKENIFKLTRLQNGWRELKDVMVMGMPSALNRVCMTIRGITLNRLLLTIGGSIAISALSVQNNVNQILSAVSMGVGMTAAMLAGLFYGERDGKMMEKTLRVSVKTGVLLITCVSALVILFARPIAGLFLEPGSPAMELGVRSLRFFCLSLPLSLLSVVMINFYQSTKNLVIANLICLSHGLVFVTIFAFTLSPALGTDGVWISFLLSETVTLTGVLLVIRKRLGKWPRKWRQFALLPDRFDPEPEKILDVSINGEMDTVMELSRRVHEFCNKHTEDEDLVRKLALAIEEMAGNIVQHGKKRNKSVTIDIRIVMLEDGISFRLRDDGVAFNPVQYGEENQESSETLGIRMIRGMAKEMRYTYAIGMNNLLIRI